MTDVHAAETSGAQEQGSIPAILERMYNIAKHGFDFFLIAAGLVLVVAGVVTPPSGWMSQTELAIVAVS